MLRHWELSLILQQYKDGGEVLTTLVNGSVRVVNEEGAGCILTSGGTGRL